MQPHLLTKRPPLGLPTVSVYSMILRTLTYVFWINTWQSTNSRKTGCAYEMSCRNMATKLSGGTFVFVPTPATILLIELERVDEVKNFKTFEKFRRQKVMFSTMIYCQLSLHLSIRVYTKLHWHVQHLGTKFIYVGFPTVFTDADCWATKTKTVKTIKETVFKVQ